MIEANLKEEAEKFKGEPMILTLVGCLSDSVTSLKPDSINEHTQPSATAIDKNTIILKLDHIRNRQVYVKTLSKWFKELDLTGLLLMHKRVVLLIITGNKNELQVCYVVLTSMCHNYYTYPLMFRSTSNVIELKMLTLIPLVVRAKRGSWRNLARWTRFSMCCLTKLVLWNK